MRGDFRGRRSLSGIAAAGALAGALAFTGAAAAAPVGYQGSVRTGTLTFKVVKRHGKRKLTGFHFHSVPISCRGGLMTASGKDRDDRFPIGAGGNFKLVLSADSADYKSRIVFKGTVTSGEAAGTFHLSGRRVPLDDGSTGHRCDTGVLDWTAKSAV